MKLAISIAVVLVALSVVTESTEVSDGEPTVSEKFETFRRDVQAFFDDVGEKAKEAIRDLHHSEFSNKTRNWFTERFRTLKEKFRTTFHSDETN